MSMTTMLDIPQSGMRCCISGQYESLCGSMPDSESRLQAALHSQLGLQYHVSVMDARYAHLTGAGSQPQGGPRPGPGPFGDLQSSGKYGKTKDDSIDHTGSWQRYSCLPDRQHDSDL